MNIFWLDECHTVAARYYCDKHLTKIVTEINQIMSTALRNEGYEMGYLYLQTHKGHPLIEWVGENNSNFYETLFHAHMLGREHRIRYGGVHKSWQDVTRNLLAEDIDIGEGLVTERPLAMPDEHKVEGDYVASYRDYYRNGKDWEMNWTDRPVPHWY